MPSITAHIKDISQPRGGYLPVKNAIVTTYDDGRTLVENESVHPSIVGMAVDYLTRIALGTSPEEAFSVSLCGASLIDEEKYSRKLLKRIDGLTPKSIEAACMLSGYDVVVRNGGVGYKDVDDMDVDDDTINNIKIMVTRSVEFWKQNGPIVLNGFTFEGAYTETISSGDGDYLTADTLWDMKVSKNKPNAKQTLQILVYYLMGTRSTHSEFKTITKLGLFNPRLNTSYIFNVADIPQDIIQIVENEVIGYGTGAPQVKKSASTSGNTSDMLTTQEVAAMAELSKSTILNYIHSGDLKAIKKGNRYLIKREDAESFIQDLEDTKGVGSLGVLVAILIPIILIATVFLAVHFL